mmetsp:Transcript_51760/g.133462  ORF Transcript_51760/g.133462 Transcript_51760/m.133462 type:complete len:329 (-) Transcript_51760:876-1862(-)
MQRATNGSYHVRGETSHGRWLFQHRPLRSEATKHHALGKLATFHARVLHDKVAGQGNQHAHREEHEVATKVSRRRNTHPVRAHVGPAPAKGADKFQCWHHRVPLHDVGAVGEQSDRTPHLPAQEGPDAAPRQEPAPCACALSRLLRRHGAVDDARQAPSKQGCRDASSDPHTLHATQQLEHENGHDVMATAKECRACDASEGDKIQHHVYEERAPRWHLLLWAGGLLLGARRVMRGPRGGRRRALQGKARCNATEVWRDACQGVEVKRTRPPATHSVQKGKRAHVRRTKDPPETQPRTRSREEPQDQVAVLACDASLAVIDSLADERC